jgi:hypothetical protein
MRGTYPSEMRVRVIGLLAAGASRREAAEQLDISDLTLDEIVSAILIRRLNSSCSRSMALVVLRHWDRATPSLPAAALAALGVVFEQSVCSPSGRPSLPRVPFASYAVHDVARARRRWIRECTSPLYTLKTVLALTGERPAPSVTLGALSLTSGR